MDARTTGGHAETGWMVRAGSAGVYASKWREEGIIGIGWDFGGADISAMTRAQLSEAYAKAHPLRDAFAARHPARQAHHFAHDLTVGSTVVTYDPGSRHYYIGQVSGPCESAPDDEGTTYTRRVQWSAEAPRDLLTKASRNSLGSLTTLFTISGEVMADLARASGARDPEPADGEVDDTTDEEARSASYEDGIERIKDRVLALGWEQVEQLTAGLLRAMGYFARVTAKGPDGGRDVEASPDALGLESPHIVAEVKHRKDPIGAPAIRSFIGGLRSGDRGLYVSTGGFSKDAVREAERANYPIRLIDLDDFVRLYIEVYDRADEEARAILPLIRIWWPA